MQELEYVSVAQATVTEHRPDRGIQGVVIYGGITGGMLVISWESREVLRTTEFDPRCWKSNIAESVVSLTRTNPNTGVGFEQPNPEVNLYTIELQLV